MNVEDKMDHDLGSGYSFSFYGFHPDRDLNPQYADIPDCDHLGATIQCPHGLGSIRFDCETARKLIERNEPGRAMWTVNNYDPLDVSPSILMQACGCHGFIRNGKWVGV